MLTRNKLQHDIHILSSADHAMASEFNGVHWLYSVQDIFRATYAPVFDLAIH